MILEPKVGNTVGAGPAGLRACGKVIYSPTLRKSDRLQLHDILAKTLDEFGEKGCALDEALEQIFADLKRRGIAVETINLATDQGQADAECNLGVAYQFGLGVPQDYTQAAAWYRKAAEQGDALAQASLGDLYDSGLGVGHDYAQAAAWYRKAAEQGTADAQNSLGRLYDNGQGVPQDYAQAVYWYRKAAEQGYDDAQNSLGRLYDNGQGVPQDYAQAVHWYRRAAEQGYALAQYNLGVLFRDHGRATYLSGVSQVYVEALRRSDHAEAYFWFAVYGFAAASSHNLYALFAEDAVKSQDEAASHLTAAELSREQERARKWFEAHRAKP